MTNAQIRRLERIMEQGRVAVKCTATGCGNRATIEPDADYLCPKCLKGRLVSPLIVAGLI